MAGKKPFPQEKTGTLWDRIHGRGAAVSGGSISDGRTGKGNGWLFGLFQG